MTAVAKPKGRPPGKRAILGADVSAKRQKRSDDPLDNDRAIKRFFHLVVEHVKYSDFIALEPALAVDAFLKLRNLAIIDRFFQLSDEEILIRLGIAEEHLAMLRSHPHYSPIMVAVQEKAAYLANPRTMDDWAKDSEDRLAGEMLLAATSEASLRDRVPAMEAFLDRTSAKKGREQEDRPPVLFPDDALKLMRFAMEMQQNMKQVGAGSTISAETLNVPNPPARLGGSPND